MKIESMEKKPHEMTAFELKIAIKMKRRELKYVTGRVPFGSMWHAYYNGGISPYSRSSEGRRRQRDLVDYLDVLMDTLSFFYMSEFVGVDPKGYPSIIDRIDDESDRITDRIRTLDIDDVSRRERVQDYKNSKTDKYIEALLTTVDAVSDYSPFDPLGSASSATDAVKATAEAIKNDYDKLIDATSNHQNEIDRLEDELSDLEVLKEQLEKAHRAALAKREAQRKRVKEQAEKKKQEAKRRRRMRNEDRAYREKHGASAYGDRNYRKGRKEAGLDDDGVLT